MTQRQPSYALLTHGVVQQATEPLAVPEIVTAVDAIRPITTKNPKSTIRGAISGHNCPARYLPAGPLDELVWQDLVQVLIQPEMINQALTRAHGGLWLPQALQARLKNMKNVLKQLERQQERLLTAYLAEVVDLPELERKRQQLQLKQSAIQQQLRQLQASASQRAELASAFDTIDAFCQHIQPVLHRASFAQRRQLVELLIDRVIVKDEDVEIRYVIPIQPKEKAPRPPFTLLRTDYR